MRKTPKRNSDRIFFILEMLLENRSMRFSEIHKESGIPKSSLHGLMNELVELKVVYYDSVTKLYSIGFNFIQLSYKCISNIDILKVIDAACLKLSRTIGETVHAAILTGTDITYISKHEGEDKVSIINNIGMTLPAHATAIGKVLLSGYSNEELKELYKNKDLRHFTPNTIVSLDKLIEDISKVRERGYAKEQGEVSLLAWCIGVPVRQNDRIVTSISVTLPMSKHNEEYEGYIIEQLNKAKDELESIINGQGFQENLYI